MHYNDFLNYLDENKLNFVLSRACHKSAPWFLGCEKQFLNILEIGRSKGHSIALFKYLWSNSAIVSIDTIKHKEVDTVINHFEGNGSVELLDGDVRVLASCKTIFDLVLIDGDHSYAGALKDWNGIQKNIGKGTTVVFDDLDHIYGCGDVYYELQKDYEHQVITHEGKEVCGVLII